MAKYGGAAIRDAGKKSGPYQPKPNEVPSGKAGDVPLMAVGKKAGMIPSGVNPTIGKGKGKKGKK